MCPGDGEIYGWPEHRVMENKTRKERGESEKGPVSPPNKQGLYPVTGGEPPIGFKQGSYEIRLRFQRDQS